MALLLVGWSWIETSAIACQDVSGPLICLPPLTNALPIIVASGFVFFGVVVWLMERPRLAAIFFLLLSGALSSGQLSSLGNRAGTQLFVIHLIWSAPVLMAFQLDPQSRRSPYRVFLAIELVVATFLSLPLLDHLFLNGRFTSSITRWYELVLLNIIITIVTIILTLIWAYRSDESMAKRDRIRLPFLLGSVLAFTPLCVLALIPSLLNAPFALPAEWAFPWLLLSPVTYLYGSTTNRDVGRDVIARRLSTYYLFFTLLAGCYLTTFALGDFVWNESASSWASPVVASLVVLLIAAPLRTLVQRFIDSVWDDRSQRYDTLLETLSKKLNLALDVQSLKQILLHDMPDALDLPSISLYLRQENSLQLIGQSANRQAVPDTLLLSSLMQVMARLPYPQQPKQLASLLGDTQGLKPDEQWLIDNAAHGGWLPLLSQNELQGLLLINLYPEHGSPSALTRFLILIGRHAGVAAHNVRLVESLRARQRELEAAQLALKSARNDERRRLARELHDDILQDLIGLAYQIQLYGKTTSPVAASATTNGHPPPHVDLIATYNDLIVIVSRLREVIQNIRPITLSQSAFISALEEYLNTLRSSLPPDDPHIELELVTELVDFPDQMTLHLFRITQEAVRNAIQHSGADTIVITIDGSERELRLSISDNGAGFEWQGNIHDFVSEEHFGLLGMSERIEELDGTLSVSTSAEEGTTVFIRVPLKQRITQEG